MDQEPSLLKVILAFTAVYIIWGSTYLAIAVAIESIPPFLMAGTRFLTAGFLLILWAMLRGAKFPTVREWKASTISGIFLMIGGNMTVVWAEQYVPSSVAAIIVASTPIWLVLLDKTQWNRLFTRPSLGFGLIVGFGGVIYLVLNGDSISAHPSEHLYFGIFLVVIAAALWSVGTLYSRSPSHSSNSLLKSGMQMFSGGAIIFAISIASGELSNFNPEAVTGRSFFSLLYLITFGALIAYSAFIWLVKVRPPAQVGTYAYVNPVVAVLLGWGLYNEMLTIHTIIALLIIIGGVLLVNRSYRGKNAG